MSIVLNEREWAENAIENYQLGKNESQALTRVAQYYYQCQGYKKNETRDKLEEFFDRCNSNTPNKEKESLLDSALRQALKRPINEIEFVGVTEKELEVIARLRNRELRRLMFTLICATKYYNIIRNITDSWVNTDGKEILEMANITTSVRERSKLYRQLAEAGLTKESKIITSLNVQVQCLDLKESPVLLITDFRNLGNQYRMYCGDAFFQCVQCGITQRRNSNSQKYCHDCAAEIYIKKSVESVMIQRTLAKSSEISPHN